MSFSFLLIIIITLYIERHDTLVKLVHWALCKRHGLGRPGSNPLKHRPDLVLRSSTQALLMDVSVPLDQNVPTKIAEKITKYAFPLPRAAAHLACG